MRSRGSHTVLEYPERHRRNLSVPLHRELSEGTLRDLIDTMGISVDEFLQLAKK